VRRGRPRHDRARGAAVGVTTFANQPRVETSPRRGLRPDTDRDANRTALGVPPAPSPWTSTPFRVKVIWTEGPPPARAPHAGFEGDGDGGRSGCRGGPSGRESPGPGGGTSTMTLPPWAVRTLTLLGGILATAGGARADKPAQPVEVEEEELRPGLVAH